ncbi:MAG TPA: ABC transporter permease [Blastocatellia bacterium]|jgi:ABC-2 type transport system permease protein
MKKIWVIIKREYLVRVRTKAFAIGTVLSPLLMLALIVLPGFLATRGGGDRNVTIIDQTGDPQLYELIRRRLESPQQEDGGAARNISTRFILSHQAVPPGEDLTPAIERYKDIVGKDSDQSFAVLPTGLYESGQPQYYARNTADISIRALEDSISAAISERRLARDGFDPAKIRQYMREVDLVTHKIGSDGEVTQGGRSDFFVAFGLLFFIYISVLIYGQVVMRGVSEEKQSRIAEIVVSSAKPTEMMLGKVIGIGLVGLTQIGIWALTAFVISAFGASFFSSRGVAVPNIAPSLLIYFVVYFLLGYFLFATLYAVVGSIVSNEEEAQQAQMPVTMLIIVPMIIFGMILSNPNSGTSIALSMVPFFAPTLMMLRIAIVNPPLWEVLLSMAIMLVTILALVWVAARIYRVGILMYGKRPSLAELGRWLRYS